MAHVSDLHLDGSERNARRAERVMAYLNDLPGPIDAVLVTGDIADHGRPDEYEQARKVLSSPHPVLTCPGNHDVRAAYREALLGVEPGDAPINQAHRVAGATVVLCDSSIPGHAEGRLDDGTLAWLDSTLAGVPAGAPALVAFHHPPALLHSPFVDAIRQHGERRLAEVIAGHPHVVAVLCGHAHTAAATTFAGRPLLVAPGVVSTLKLPWERGDVLDYDLPPAIAFHVLDDHDGTWRLTTHYRVIGQGATGLGT
jgi:3',5'-cyclic-AMP phosphodiesterase